MRRSPRVSAETVSSTAIRGEGAMMIVLRVQKRMSEHVAAAAQLGQLLKAATTLQPHLPVACR